MLANTVSGEKAVGDVVISVSHVSKTYKLYPSHQDRLKEALHPFRKRYHEEYSALSDVSFEIRRGESVGILGRNGAGKSTLLQLIAGVLHPTSGSVRVTGKVAALLELGAGFNPDLTGRENVVLASTIQGDDEGEIKNRISQVEAFADIGIFFDQPMKVYSSGMFARVAFANAIHGNPNILIIDEILGVGDAKFQEKCYNKINSLKEAGVCILFVSHSTEVIQRNCERALLLEGGRLVRNGSTEAIVAAYHDLLYGAKKVAESKPDLASQALTELLSQFQSQSNTQDSDPALFLSNPANPRYQDRPYYNPNERRIGNGEAEIVDFLVLVDGDEHFSVLAGNETIHIYFKAKFNRDVKAPQIGWAVVSSEGIVIAGSNTVMQRVSLCPTGKDEIRTYKVEIKLSLCGGQYFINLGLSEYLNKEWNYFDNRRSLIHLAIADAGRSSGFFPMASTFEDAA